MSAEGLKVELQDGIRVLTLANPPTNALTSEIRAALLGQIAHPTEDCRGFVLAGEGASFSSHLPLDPDHSDPSLAELCRAVAECPVPVVAVVHGLVTGPGAELALAARARLAASSLRIAFADVSLGLCPAAGSSQRLPRLIGAKAALRLLLTGRPVPASEALSLGLVDGITESIPLSAAVRLAGALAVRELLTRQAPDPAEWQNAIAAARREQAARLPANRRIVDCVEAALLLPVENGLAFEAVVRRDLEQTVEAAGLRAAAKAERRALAVPAVMARLRPLSVNQIGLSGTSPGLVPLAIAALSRGLGVAWVFPGEEARKSGVATIEAGIAEAQRAGSLSPEQALDMRTRLNATEDHKALATLPFLIHDRRPDPTGDRGGLPGAAHVVLGGADGEMGLALAPSQRVCELSSAEGVPPLARATAIAGLRRMGISPLLVGERPVLGSRLAEAGRTAIAWMLARGVPRRLIASALDEFGARRLEDFSAEAPTVLRAMPAPEVLNRWLAALANEGARLLDEGLALHASDIDYLMVAGQFFPRWQGGPMHQADERGLMVVRHDLRAWGAEAALWSPAPLIDRLIRDGQGFAALGGQAV
ncbi:enoyl-CoA hydratase-related protein [Tabrizicola sp.]|uniref:enoyl-CoA hydratase/isomerase family protein n=1 Tax=Tabrizicola sp. TaxID=2005166 RepID=UPI003F2DF6E4